MMQAGLGTLGLSPRDFWAATPREIAAALGTAERPQALARADLDRLINNFPDQT